MERFNKGLTSIQLISIVVVLAIVAAVVVPRFMKLNSNARILEINGMLGEVRSATEKVHNEAVQNNQTAITGIISFNDTKIKLAYGYPAADSGGIDNAVKDFSGFHFAKGIFNLQDANKTNIKDCFVSYKEPTEANTSPIITAITTGC